MREALRVGVQLALVDQRGLVLVQVFDRVLDRQDVRRPRQVDPVDHRGERRRLAAAGRAGDEHEAARPVGQLGEHRRQAQLLERADLLGNQTVDGADRALLVEHVATEAADAAQTEGEVELPGLLELLLLRVGEHAVGQRLGQRRASGRGTRAAADRRPRAPAAGEPIERCKSDPPSSSVALSKSGRFISPTSSPGPLLRSCVIAFAHLAQPALTQRAPCPRPSRASRSSITGAFAMTISRSGSLISMTSNNPTRPL